MKHLKYNTLAFHQMKKAFQIMAFVIVSLLLIWGVLFFSNLCIGAIIPILRSREVLSDHITDFVPLLASLICGIVATIKFWKRYWHVIIPGYDAKYSLRDDNSQSEGVKRVLSVIFYLAAILLLAWTLFLSIVFLVLALSQIGLLVLAFSTTEWFHHLLDLLRYGIPVIIIFICDVFVFCICIKRLGRELGWYE